MSLVNHKTKTEKEGGETGAVTAVHAHQTAHLILPCVIGSETETNPNHQSFFQIDSKPLKKL